MEPDKGVLRIDGLDVRLGRIDVLRSFELETSAGEYLTLMGPSGCGKSSLLRVIAGLLAPRAGSVALDSKTLTEGRKVEVAPHRRGIGMVFQGQALWPHMNARKTLEFVLKRNEDLKGRALRSRAAELLDQVQIQDRATHVPGRMSGGERQRLAIARALASRPRLLLLDEPLGPLDANLRQGISELIRRLHDEYGLTTLHVTHDQEEAFAMGDRTALLHEGRIHQIGTRDEFRERPVSSFVTGFLS